MLRKKCCSRVCLLAFLALSALLLSACSSAPQTPQLNDTPRHSGLSGPVVDQRWNLLLVGTDERLSFAEAPFFTISSDGTVAGYDGCNRFKGHVSLGESHRIDFEGIATTRMACANMADAKRVTDMLDTAYRYLIDHDRLVFFGPDSRVLGGWRKAH